MGTAKQVETGAWERSNPTKRPRGWGQWWFTFRRSDGSTWSNSHTGTWTEAKRMALVEARMKGAERVEVLP